MKSSWRLAGVWYLTTTVGRGETVHSVGNIFNPQATPAELIYHLSLLEIAVCAAIFVVVAAMLTFTIVRFRRKAGDRSEPAQVYGSNRIEIAWTVIPILIVLVLTQLPSLDLSRDILAHQAKRLSMLRDSGSGGVDPGSPNRALGLPTKNVNQPAWFAHLLAQAELEQMIGRTPGQ